MFIIDDNTLQLNYISSIYPHETAYLLSTRVQINDPSILRS